MAQTWESQGIQDQGNAYNQALQQLRAAQAAKDTNAEATARAAMAAAHNNAQQQRAGQNYTADASGLNATPLQQQVVQPQMSQAPQVNTTDYINQLKNAQIANKTAALDKQKASSLSNLDAERAKIEPTAYANRNAANITMNNSNRAWDEFLASKGLTSSGISGEGFRTNFNQYQGQVGAINRDAANQQTDINRRVTEVNNNYASDLAAAQAGAQATALQNLLNQYNADRSYGLDVAGITGNYNGQRTLQGQQYDNQVKQQNLDNLYRQQTFDYQKSRDAVSDKQWQQQMNLNLRQQTFAEAQQKIENSLAQKRISQEDASQALQWAKFNADQDPNSLDNQYKKAQIDQMNGKVNTNTTNTVDDYSSYINSNYKKIVGVDANQKPIYSNEIDTSKVRDYIKSLVAAGVDRSIIEELGRKYNVQ